MDKASYGDEPRTSMCDVRVSSTINIAFLNGDLKENMQMDVTHDYIALGRKMCLLKIAFYGLKQASTNCHVKLYVDGLLLMEKGIQGV